MMDASDGAAQKPLQLTPSARTAEGGGTPVRAKRSSSAGKNTASLVDPLTGDAVSLPELPRNVARGPDRTRGVVAADGSLCPVQRHAIGTQSFDKEKDVNSVHVPSLDMTLPLVFYLMMKSILSHVIVRSYSPAVFSVFISTESPLKISDVSVPCKVHIPDPKLIFSIELCPEKRMFIIHTFQRYVQATLSYPRDRKRRMNGSEGWLPFCVYCDGTWLCSQNTTTRTKGT
ncbi:hypothetical protein EJB05_26811, partial [Eragrostis curvula]